MERLFRMPADEMSSTVTVIEIDINDVLKLNTFKDERHFEEWLQMNIWHKYLNKCRWLLINLHGGLGYMKIRNKYLIAMPFKKEMIANFLDIPYKVVE